MKFADKIRYLCKCSGVSESELARRLNTTPQNLSNKLGRDNFTVNELEKIANALGCTFEARFVVNNTGDKC